MKKRSKMFLRNSILILILSVTAALYWFTPTHIQVSDLQEVNLSIRILGKDTTLDDEEKNQLINHLSDTELYRGGSSAIISADKSSNIIINGRGVESNYLHTTFYILHDRPNLSFAEIRGRKYRKNLSKFQVFAFKLLYSISISRSFSSTKE